MAATIDDADRTLSSPSLFGRTDARELRAVLDQARRVRLELSTIAGLRARLSADGNRQAEAAIGACLEDAAAALAAIAAALRHPEQALSWQAASAYQQRLAELEATLARTDTTRGLGPEQSVAALAAIGGQIRAAGNLVEAAGATGMREAWRPSIAIPEIPTPGRLRREVRAVLENLHTQSPAFRHAVRLAIAVPASAVVASWLGLPRSFWVPYAVALTAWAAYSTWSRASRWASGSSRPSCSSC